MSLSISSQDRLSQVPKAVLENGILPFFTWKEIAKIRQLSSNFFKLINNYLDKKALKLDIPAKYLARQGICTTEELRQRLDLCFNRLSPSMKFTCYTAPNCSFVIERTKIPADRANAQSNTVYLMDSTLGKSKEVILFDKPIVPVGTFCNYNHRSTNVNGRFSGLDVELVGRIPLIVDSDDQKRWQKKVALFEKTLMDLENVIGESFKKLGLFDGDSFKCMFDMFKKSRLSSSGCLDSADLDITEHVTRAIRQIIPELEMFITPATKEIINGNKNYLVNFVDLIFLRTVTPITYELRSKMNLLCKGFFPDIHWEQMGDDEFKEKLRLAFNELTDKVASMLTPTLNQDFINIVASRVQSVMSIPPDLLYPDYTHHPLASVANACYNRLKEAEDRADAINELVEPVEPARDRRVPGIMDVIKLAVVFYVGSLAWGRDRTLVGSINSEITVMPAGIELACICLFLYMLRG